MSSKIEFADVLRKWWSFDSHQQHTHSWHTREDFIERELPKLLGVEPFGRLKGLVWERDGGPHFAYAYNDSFRYSVRQTQLGCFWIVRGAAGKLGGTKCDSIDHGKQLAEADYAMRVRELFEPLGTEEGT